MHLIVTYVTLQNPHNTQCDWQCMVTAFLILMFIKLSNFGICFNLHRHYNFKLNQYGMII